MSDFYAAPNASTSGGLQTLKDMMSLKLQQQALQSGQLSMQGQQSENQSLAAKAQGDTRAMQEQQSVAKMLSSGKDDQGNDIRGADGTPDATKVLPALGRMAPITGQKYAQSIIETKTNAAKLEGASQSLDAQGRSMLMGPVQAAIANPDAKAADINAGIDNLVQQHPEMGPSATYLKTLTAHFDNAKTPEQRTQIANGIAASMQGGQAVDTQPKAASVDNGSQTLIGTTAPPVTGGNFTPSTAVAKQLGPTDQPNYKAAVASATELGGGTAGGDVKRANEVGDLQQQSAAAIPLTKRIDELSHEINSGHLAKMISESGNYLGFSSINEARSQLNKDLGQVKGLAISKAGSDSRAATVLEGYPTDTTPEDTTHAAMDYIRGTARQNLARGKILEKYQQSDPNGLKGFQHADNIVSSQTNPLMHEYLALKPSEQAGFYRRNFSTPQEAQEFKNQVNALKQHTNVLGQ